jgi:phage shock protein A
MMLLLSLTMFSGEFKVIRAENGKFYMDEETVIALANYIQKLEDLNQNYKLQIANLEEQVRNLKGMINAYEEKVALLEQKNKALQEEITALKAKYAIWSVVAAIAVGAVVYLFVK